MPRLTSGLANPFLADRVTQITYPSGRIVQYGYDSKGRVNLVQTKANAGVGSWTTVADGFSYEPFGSVKGMALGNGLSVAIDWGNDGRLASRRLYQTSGGTNLSFLSYTYDPNDNISAIINQLDDAQSVYYGYDVNDRLIQTSVAGSGTSSSETYSYTSGTNRLASISDGTNTRSISYDGRGNTSAETRPGSVSASTAYDGYGRLTDYDRTDIGTLDFAYNGLDDRVAMTSGAGTRRFVYDGDGRVLGEYGASASDVKAEFIWLTPTVGLGSQFGGDDGTGGYTPLAVATPNSGGTVVLNWVHGNHLGVPVSITDGSGAAATTPNDYLAPGFPGQSKVLADLYYNRYRDFDPTTGRYIQADPIGLSGGQNIFGYAENNPIRWTDPSGKCPWCVAAAGGAIVSVLIDLGTQAATNWITGRNVLDANCYDWWSVGTSAVAGALTGGAPFLRIMKVAAAEREIARGAANRTAFEAYKDSLRAGMEKPFTSDRRLTSLLDDLYRPKPRLAVAAPPLR